MLRFSAIPSWLTCCSILVIVALTTPIAGQEVNFGDLSRKTGYQRVNFMLDVSGTVLLKPGSEPGRSLPLSVEGRFSYLEKIIRTEPTTQVARQYDSASASIAVGQGKTHSELSEQDQYYILESHPDPRTAKLRFRRPDGPITAEQSELIEVPIDSSQLHLLLPIKSTVSVKEKWTPEADSLAPLFWIDNVAQSTVECSLFQLNGDEATIFCTGKLIGGVHGVATEIRITGSVKVNVSQQRFSSCKFTVQEKRTISQAQPGFDITAKIDARFSAAGGTDLLSDARIASWDIQDAAPATMMSFESSQGGFRFLHNPSWTVISDTKPVSVLRMIDHGDLIAQCNISRLQDLSKGQSVSLDEFKQDVMKAVAQHQGQLLQAETLPSRNGNQILRVAAGGAIEQVPLQWIYYHLTAPTGHRVAIVVSIENEMLERYEAADRTIIDSFEILELAAEPTAATESDSAQRPSTSNSIKR